MEKIANNKKLCIIILLLTSLFLNLWNNDFPIGYHNDEVKKANFILTGTQDYHHPILMLSIVRVANFLFKFDSSYQIMLLGRTICAIFGTLIIMIFFLFTSKFLAPIFSFLSSLTLASLPIMVVHAHYLKEDIFFTFFAILTLITFFSLLTTPSKLLTLATGLFCGLSISSQYKGLLLYFIFLMSPLVFHPKSRFRLYQHIMWVIIISITIFFVMNYTILKEFSLFTNAVDYSINHVTIGHQLKIYPLPHFFSFHLINSIMPGITPLVTAFSILFIFYYSIKWNNLMMEERILLIYIWLFYLAHEITPMKPYPDFMRYMLPIIPPMMFFAFKGLENLQDSRFPKFILNTLILFIIISPLQSSLRLDYYMTRDTRMKAAAILKGKSVFFDWYSSANPDTFQPVADTSLNELSDQHFDYLVVSSFVYQRYEYGAKLAGQDDYVYKRNNAYQEFFKYNYQEIQPDYKTFAFSNPTIRIIDISKNRQPDQVH
jgi:hypothetical protein